MKCLEKDRNRRYETANSLALDIQRHLNDEPVAACPPSQIYRLKKFIRRHRIGVLAGSAIAAALLAGLTLATIGFVQARRQAVRADREAEIARTQAARSEEIAQFLKDMLQGVDPLIAVGRDTTLLREILDKTASRLGQELSDQPEVEADLRNTLGTVYLSLGEYEQAELMHRRALAINRQLFGNEDLHVAKSLALLAGAVRRHPQYQRAEAEEMFRQALEIQRKLLKGGDADLAYTLNGLGAVLNDQGKVAEAETPLREALAMRRLVNGKWQPHVADSLHMLAHSLRSQGKLAEAEATLQECLAIRRNQLGSVHPNVGFTLYSLGDVLHRQGNLEQAETIYREALAMERKMLRADHPRVIDMSNGLVNVLTDRGKLAEAIAIRREVLELDPKSPESHNGLAWILATCADPKLRDPPRAVELAKKAVEWAPDIANYWNTQGVAQYRAGNWQAAINSLEKSIELVADNDIGGGASGESWNKFFLAMAHWQLGEKEEARKWYKMSVEWMEKYESDNDELRRFRAEAAELLGISDPHSTTPTSD
jgi:tetratricopeptide (TPR) repeat protein